jgi:hypothetical protein
MLEKLRNNDMHGMSKTKKMVLSIIDNIREQVLNDCDDETLTSRMCDLRVIDQGAFHEDDYYTYDEAITELGIGYNRNRLSELAKKHNIRNRKFKNVPVGFHKDDINKLKIILSKK